MSITYFVVLPFVRDSDGNLLAIEAEEAPSDGTARIRAQLRVGQRVGADEVVGAIAFSRTGDPQFGDFADAIVLARYGETPDTMDIS